MSIKVSEAEARSRHEAYATEDRIADLLSEGADRAQDAIEHILGRVQGVVADGGPDLPDIEVDMRTAMRQLQREVAAVQEQLEARLDGSSAITGRQAAAALGIGALMLAGAAAVLLVLRRRRRAARRKARRKAR